MGAAVVAADPTGHLVALASTLWLFLVRLVWRSQALSRYLGMELVSKEIVGDKSESSTPARRWRRLGDSQ